MAFYRSYKKSDSYKATYSYTACLVGGSEPVQTSASAINNTSFNYPLIIGNNVVSCIDMLNGCTSYNQPLTVPIQVTDCANMLYNCTNMGANVYIKGNPYVSGMLGKKNKSKRVNVFFNEQKYTSHSFFYYIVAVEDPYDYDSHNVDWTYDGDNCAYNTYYNIYVYLNYTG